VIRHARQLVTAALGTAILLTACTGTGGLKALDRAATAEGALPASVSVAEANPESVRLLAGTGGVKYFGAKGENGSLGCIVVFPTAKPEKWGACASRPTNGEIVTVSGRTAPGPPGRTGSSRRSASATPRTASSTRPTGKSSRLGWNPSPG
jgi:hypothetical protein